MDALHLPRVFRRLDSVRWDSWVRGDGQVEGALSLRLAP
jgi:hypothetical protein